MEREQAYIEYQVRLQRNLVVLRDLFSQNLQREYPKLSEYASSYRGKGTMQRLYDLLSYFSVYGDEQHEFLSYHSGKQGNGRGVEMFMSRAEMARLLGGDEKAWRDTIARLCTFGLLSVFKPRLDSGQAFRNTPAQQRSADRAKAKGKHYHPVSWYRVPEYTPETLERAEKRVEIVKRLGASVSNKNAVRRVLGATEANRIFDSGYSKPSKRTQLQIDTLTECCQQLLSVYGRTDPKAIIDAADKVLNAEYHAALIEDFPTRKHSLYAIRKTWSANRDTILESINAKYGCPPASIRATDSRKWLVYAV